MSKENLTEEQVVQRVYEYAAEQKRDGASQALIKSRLIEQGLDEESAHVVAENIEQQYNVEVSKAGEKNMLYGGLWFIGGVIVTAVTLSAASGGGTYVIAWGAILFGTIQFFRGVAQRAKR